MKRQNILPIAAIALLLVMIIASAAREVGARRVEVPPALPEITSATQPMTVDEIHARLIRTFDAASPGCYYLEVDKGAATITVDVWSEGFNATVPNAALHYREYLTKWRSNLENMRQLGDQTQQLISDHGHPEISFILRLVNDDDHGQIFAVIERGEVVYDVVEDTPAGQEVPDPASRVLPGETATVYLGYVVNTNSGVFHLATCAWADDIAAYNRMDYTGDRADLIAQGYKPCSYCDP